MWNIEKQYSLRSDETAQNVASDQGPHCLLTEWYVKILNINEKYQTTTLRMDL